MCAQYSYCMYMNDSKVDTTVLHTGPLLRSNTPICQLLTLAAMAHSCTPGLALLPAKGYLAMANGWLMQKCTASTPLFQYGVTLKSHPSSRLHRMGWVLNFNHIGTWLCILLYFAFLPYIFLWQSLLNGSHRALLLRLLSGSPTEKES